MNKIVLLIYLLLITACIGMTKTQLEEREWRELVDLANWEQCVVAYRAADRYTLHLDHTHGPRDYVQPWDIKRDLQVNNCQPVLRELWQEY